MEASQRNQENRKWVWVDWFAGVGRKKYNISIRRRLEEDKAKQKI